jgi:GMP synthase (glutamine-hydrolysing)
MEVDIIQCGSSKTPKIKVVLTSLGCNVNVYELEKLGEYVQNKPLVISGAPILLTEIDSTDLIKEFDFIKTAKYPILGICFGHQVIGMQFGAKVERCNDARSDQIIQLTQDHDLFRGMNEKPIFNEDHCECISLPKNFNLLASSVICDVEAMAHKDKSLIGVQFHPETSDENGIQFFENWLKIIT